MKKPKFMQTSVDSTLPDFNACSTHQLMIQEWQKWLSYSEEQTADVGHPAAQLKRIQSRIDF